MPSLNVPQSQFLLLPHKFRAFVAGFGSGKTWVGCSALSKHFMEWPGVNAGYFAPTYPQIRDIFYPTMEEVAYDWGLKTKINQANHEVHIYSGRQYRGTVICRSMEKPQTIVGFKIGHALVDELDVLTSLKAQQAWRKIIARMRYNLPGLKNGVDVTTTPEGFKFVFLQFVKQLREKPALKDMYGLIQASSVLSLVVSNVSEAYSQCLVWMAEFVNATGETLYKLNQDFSQITLDATILSALFNAVQGGKLPAGDFWQYLRDRGVIDPEKTDDQIRDELETENPGPDLDDDEVTPNGGKPSDP